MCKWCSQASDAEKVRFAPIKLHDLLLGYICFSFLKLYNLHRISWPVTELDIEEDETGDLGREEEGSIRVAGVGSKEEE